MRVVGLAGHQELGVCVREAAAAEGGGEAAAAEGGGEEVEMGGKVVEFEVSWQKWRRPPLQLFARLQWQQI